MIKGFQVITCKFSSFRPFLLPSFLITVPCYEYLSVFRTRGPPLARKVKNSESRSIQLVNHDSLEGRRARSTQHYHAFVDRQLKKIGTRVPKTEHQNAKSTSLGIIRKIHGDTSSRFSALQSDDVCVRRGSQVRGVLPQEEAPWGAVGLAGLRAIVH